MKDIQDQMNLRLKISQARWHFQAVQLVTESRRASVSGVQRRLKVGYNRASRLVEAMEAAGVVTAMQPNGSREVIAPPTRD